jgi:protein-S-isoprenylcysteine O-methyltransferase Ste14
MQLAVPIGLPQLWLFEVLALVFFVFLIRAFRLRGRETKANRDGRSRAGVIIQSVGIALAGAGWPRPTLAPLGAESLVGSAIVALLMGAAIFLFAMSSRALGRNWSIIARTRSDHELVRTGPYAYVRHPIYLGLLCFLLALAAALGHWLQLIVAIPVFLAGTISRTRIEDDLLEQSFGDQFREYRNSTPSLIPKIL